MALSIEKAAELGFYLVHKAEGLVRFERVHAAGTTKFEAASEDEALAEIESTLATHPGALGTDIARSDGAAEPRDILEQHSVQVGTPGPAPAADIEVATSANAAATVEVTASTAGDVQASPAPAEDAAPEVES